MAIPTSNVASSPFYQEDGVEPEDGVESLHREFVERSKVAAEQAEYHEARASEYRAIQRAMEAGAESLCPSQAMEMPPLGR